MRKVKESTAMYPLFTKYSKCSLLLLASLLLGACDTLQGLGSTDKHSSANKAFEKKISPEYKRAISLMQANDMQAAEEKFSALVKQYPQLAGAWSNLGLIHLKAGRWEKAEDNLQQALKLNPKHAPSYNYLGVVKRNQGQFTKSEQAYKKALEANPSYALAWLNLGILYDIYMDKPAMALIQYEHYQQLTANADKKVNKWIVEIKRRIPKQSGLIDSVGDRLNG